MTDEVELDYTDLEARCSVSAPNLISKQAVANALAALRESLDSMMYRERHHTPYEALKIAQGKLDATIAALGLTTAQPTASSAPSSDAELPTS